jgi:GDPmannose 4,6-dehydratase
MLQQPGPDDYILATGFAHSIRDFLDAAFKAVNLDWQDYVEQDPKYMRPSEVTQLVGDASKAKEKLGWTATTNLHELAKRMVRSDREQQQNASYLSP